MDQFSQRYFEFKEYIPYLHLIERNNFRNPLFDAIYNEMEDNFN